MKEHISFKDTLVIGLMLFALFFGAGNLVFPALMGQASGDQFIAANLGFLVTGVGLPLLATIAFGFSGSKSLLQLSSRVHPAFAVVYTTLLYLTIGPLFAMPRTGSVSYEIAVKPYLNVENDQFILLVFTFVYFLVTLLFSLNPSKLIDIVGKILTPALIIFIAFIGLTALINPIGQPVAPKDDYISHPFFMGFQEGYLTMDTLAAFVFGIIVIDAIRAKGVPSKKKILVICLQAALISAFVLALIYSVITYIGATSVSAIGVKENGGEVLIAVTQYFYNQSGGLILGAIVILACLTTSIGLTSASASYFSQLIPVLSYRTCAIILSLISMLFANLGLKHLIELSVPVLSILYPIAIMLIILTFTHSLFRGKRSVYMISLLFVFVISFVDTLSKVHPFITKLDEIFTQYLPIYHLGLGWLIPGFIGALIGLLIPSKADESQ